MPRILFVEDEENVLTTLKRFFEREEYDVYGARGRSEALELARRFPPDLAVLDVMLNEGPEPEHDGFDVCRALRDEDYAGPVIFVTARTSETDKLQGFDLGADDYVTKPFAGRDLVARIQALLDGGG
ncbi:MAG: response regulator [Myxococcales bacterium]|nr:response regulator [Myxococcales bacterium]